MQAKQRGTAKGENTEQREQENGAQRCPARSSQAAVAAVEWKLRVEAIPIASSPPARGAPARQRRRTLPDIHAPPEQARATSGPKIEVDRIHCTVRRTAVAAHAQRVLLSHYAVGKVPGDAELKSPRFIRWQTIASKHGGLIRLAGGIRPGRLLCGRLAYRTQARPVVSLLSVSCLTEGSG